MILLELFYTFFYIGIVTFGGGYAMLPLMQSVVLKNEWLTHNQLVDFIAVSESTPGPFAVNMATYIGAEQGGVLGSLCATLGVVLPSFMIILIVAKIYEAFNKSRFVKGIMTGLKPAVIGLIASAVLGIAETVFFPEGIVLNNISVKEILCSIIIFAIMFYLIIKKKKHPVLIIALSALLGILARYFIL